MTAREAAVTHIAFTYNSAVRIVLRDSIGAVPGAVLATDAGFSAVAYDSGEIVLGVGIYRAARHAGRL